MLIVNLKLHLLSRIVLIALTCLLAIASYVLYQADRQSRAETQVIAEAIGKQLELQLWRIDAGFGQPERFPDFDLWKETRALPGICIDFVSANHRLKRSMCTGSLNSAETCPAWFEYLYQAVFNPGAEAVRPVVFNGKTHGTVTVAGNADAEIATAWQHIRGLSELAASMAAALCLVVYVTVSRILQPAHLIVAGLEKMQQGELSVRLPVFELLEWQRTGAAINQLAANQEKLLADRKKLIMKLMSLQEEERRYLARELHDEFSQCLAAINAVAASISQTAETECPVLVPEAKNIRRISTHMMELLRGLLLRLRPAGLDELGLTASLTSLVLGWNAQSGGKIDYQMMILGESDCLPEPVATTIFRIVQECLTNIAKHSAASHAQVTLAITSDSETERTAIELTIEDDGIIDKLPFADHHGLGLLGITERVTALDGRLNLATKRPSGLIVQVWLPFSVIGNSQTL